MKGDLNTGTEKKIESLSSAENALCRNYLIRKVKLMTCLN